MGRSDFTRNNAHKVASAISYDKLGDFLNNVTKKKKRKKFFPLD